VTTRWRLLIAGVIVLALALPVAIGVASWRSRTQRAGSGAGPAAPALAEVSADQDRAVAAVLTAVGDRAAVAVTSAVPVRTCVAGAAHGWVFSRSADLYLDPGGEDGLIGAIDAGLPSEYQRRRGTPPGGGAAPLTAQVGASVTLTVAQLGEGWVRASAQSDCRTGPSAAPSTSDTPPAAVGQLLAALGTAPDTVQATALPCSVNGRAGGGRTVTWSALSKPADTGQLPARLAPTLPPAARRFASPANRLPFRDGHDSGVVAAADDGTRITVQYTTDCG
jgi:hypothetical protein